MGQFSLLSSLDVAIGHFAVGHFGHTENVVSFHFAKFQFAKFQLPVRSGLGIWLGSGIWVWIEIGIGLKFGEWKFGELDWNRKCMGHFGRGHFGTDRKCSVNFIKLMLTAELVCTRYVFLEVDSYRMELEDVKVRGKHCPKPIKTWAQCGVSKKELDCLKK